ncbi:tetratricopeptide repeat protein [Hymenobacter glacieicola]|uniref:Sel1 repeat family protein n=1 Tax=Hymenobacter glacieicola TaxID=1562124 RepID=A0ABQ1X413_9BACT|nr:SEL1-like repeat protein [Hymenobacter glacieicola]GGG55070.1 hypothetical protein GCM10011378_34030 [Hymenobacter glacieicola]
MRTLGILLVLLGLAISWCQAQPGSTLLDRAHHHQQAAEFEQALLYLQRAAGAGSAPAQYELGIAYHSGQGTNRNDTLAVDWLKKAAQQHHTPAQALLGAEFWYSGLLSKKQMLAWLREGAAAGDLSSLVSLQHYCDSTYADSPAPPIAAYPLQLRKQIAARATAATAADSATIFQQALSLGVWCQKGYRLPRNPVESYAWYLLMNEMHTITVHILWTEAMRTIARLHQQLSPAQRAQALHDAEAIGKRKLRRLSQFTQAMARFKAVPAASDTSAGWE